MMRDLRHDFLTILRVTGLGLTDCWVLEEAHFIPAFCTAPEYNR